MSNNEAIAGLIEQAAERYWDKDLERRFVTLTEMMEWLADRVYLLSAAELLQAKNELKTYKDMYRIDEINQRLKDYSEGYRDVVAENKRLQAELAQTNHSLEIVNKDRTRLITEINALRYAYSNVPTFDKDEVPF